MMNPKEYLRSRFPESLFSAINSEEYLSSLYLGADNAKNLNVVIAGLCRDTIDTIHQTMCRLQHMSSLFKSSKIVIYENDSCDGTSEVLKGYSLQNDNLILIQEKLNNEGYKGFNTENLYQPTDTSFERAEYLAGLRNMYLEEIRLIQTPIDYVIVVDLDLEGGWSYDGILNSFAYDSWSAMTGNGVLFRKKNTSHKNLTEAEYERLFFDTWAYRQYGNEKVLSSGDTNKLVFDRGESPTAVFSNFNGIGIYKYDDLIRCEYGALEHEDGTVDCDHPFLHKQMRDNGCSIYLNPSLITLYSPHEFSVNI